MPLKLMYITNQPGVAKIAEDAGVDRIFIDMEYIGKSARQGGMDTVQNHHTVEDIRNIRNTVMKADILARVNPIHDACEEHISSEQEIEEVIEAGADIVMLPYFKTPEEVSRFIRNVNGRARTLLLFETPESVEKVDDILGIEGIDEVYIGLNDLSLGYGKKFMFELLADGTVEKLCGKFREMQLPYGFGGIAALGKGMLPSEYVIREHYRLGSTCAILSRSFCNTEQIDDVNKIRKIFMDGVKEIRDLEEECDRYQNYFIENHKETIKRIKRICEEQK